MNTEQTKQIPLVDFIKQLGYTPTHQKQNTYWYKSPFREENTPSFKVDMNKNLWYDFGLGKGGTIISFMGILKSTDSISDILKYIEQVCSGISRSDTQVTQTPFYFDQQDKEPKKIQAKIVELTSPTLKKYLRDRAITTDKLYQYIWQANIRVKDKTHYTLAFANSLGGYELRNSYYKGCTSKAITTIRSNVDTPIFVFEGFFDFLSFCELIIQAGDDARKFANGSNFLIMNSTALIKQTIDYLAPFKDIRLFLDNDDTGVSSTLKIKLQYPQAKDLSNLYENHKDLNEYLVSLKGKSDKGFLSRCAIVRTETKVSADNSDLAFTPHGRKREESTNNVLKENVRKTDKCSQSEHIRKRGRGICR